MSTILIKCKHGINDHAFVSALENGIHIQRCRITNDIINMNDAEFLSYSEHPEIAGIHDRGAWDVAELANLMIEYGECE